jgi:2-hydroxychromene-2-carboxylate isomerase
MAPTLEYYFDYASPYSYLADSRLPALVERTGAEIIYRPVLLGAVVVESKNTPPPSVPAKARHLPVDLGRWARRYGLAFGLNGHFPMNSVRSLRAALVLLEEGGFRPYHDAMFRAVWAEGANAADPVVVGEVAARAGLDAAHLLERIEEPAIKERLKADTACVVERGAFGLPTFFVGDEMFFGNDRLEFVQKALLAES